MGLLDGKVCLVSGAGQGLGRAISREMAAEGAAVVLLERNGETVAAVAQEIAKAGGTAHPYQLDVTDYDGYGKVVADVAMKLGRIDVLVNNAAINPPTRTILNDTLEDWRRTIAINLEAVYMGIKLVAPHMVASNERAHHPHRVDPGLCLQRRLRVLQCREGRHHRLHEVDGGGAWPLQHSRQCRGAGLHGDADVGGQWRRRDDDARLHRLVRRHAGRFRSDAAGFRRMSPAPWSFSRRTTAAT